MKSIFLLKKQEKYLELPLIRFVTGIKQIKSILLGLHPEHASTVLRIFKTFLIAVLLFKKKRKIAYCRVSSKKQEDDLERQKDFFRTKYPDYELVTDIGSGINWKRKGLKTILESAMQGNLSELMVAHRDRLCRFGFELVEWILERNNVKLSVLDREDHKSPDHDLTDDILSIIHIYSCRQMGKRRYKIKEDKNLSNSETEEDV